jgi:AcrR family transcriptional regulator
VQELSPSPTKRRRRLSGAERRASIVVAATEVFAELGYQRGTMSEVARRVGVSEPVVFQNFGSKAAVFAAVLDEAAERMSAAMRGHVAENGSVAAWLEELLAPHRLPGVHAHGAVGALFADAMSLTAEPQVAGAARLAHGRIAGTLADLIARGQAEGGIRPDLDAEASSWWLLSFLASKDFRTATMPDCERLESQIGAMTLKMLTAG